MKLNPFVVCVGIALAMAAPQAKAVTVFSENFEGATLGAPQTSIPQFTVLSGTVDVIGPGFYNVAPNGGKYLDLDGTGGSPDPNGTILSSAFNIFQGVTYTVSFDYAGDHRGYGGNGIDVFYTLDGGSFEYLIASLGPLPSAFGFTEFTWTTPSGVNAFAQLGFRSTGTADGQGALLDNVKVTNDVPNVPDGGTTAALLGIAMTGVGLVRRKMQS